MSVKTYKPYTPSRRQMAVLSNEGLTKKAPEKSLVVTLKKSGGRNYGNKNQAKKNYRL